MILGLVRRFGEGDSTQGGAGPRIVSAFIAKLVSAAAGLLVSVLVARLLGPSGTGVYFLAVTVVGIGGIGSGLGLGNAVLRFAGIARARVDRGALAAIYRLSFMMTLGAGVVVATALGLLTTFIPLAGDGTAKFHIVLRIMSVGLPVFALLNLQGQFFMATGSSAVGVFLQSALPPLMLSAGVAALLISGGGTVAWVARLRVAALMGSLALALLLWERRMPGLWRERGKFELGLLLRTSLPLLWIAGMNLVMTWTDTLVLGYWTTPSVVGTYSVATRTATAMAFILAAVNSVAAPRFAALFADERRSALERFARKSTLLMIVAALPVLAVFLAFPRAVLSFFGEGFAQAATVLRILALGQFVNVAVGSVGYLLTMTGHEKAMRNTIVASALLNLLGNLVLVPRWGALGAAASTAGSLALMNLVAYILVRLKLGIDTLGLRPIGGDT